jgi:hypothetical protein
MNATPMYLAQDNLSNAAGNFTITLQSCLLRQDWVSDINQGLNNERIGAGVAAVYQNTITDSGYAVIIHCTCKLGIPQGDLTLHFESVTNLRISWPGVSRIFIRTRIMENTTLDVLMDMLRDDIRSRHSVSDVENPEMDQSFRPWSDQDDSETDTNDEAD